MVRMVESLPVSGKSPGVGLGAGAVGVTTVGATLTSVGSGGYPFAEATPPTARDDAPIAKIASAFFTVPPTITSAVEATNLLRPAFDTLPHGEGSAKPIPEFLCSSNLLCTNSWLPNQSRHFLSDAKLLPC